MPFSKSVIIYDDIYTKIRDYESQSNKIIEWIKNRHPDARSLLDVACGTGLHLSYLRSKFNVVGLDICPSMLKIAQSRNEGVSFHQGDMRNFRLNHRFDVIVCLFSSITYSDSVEGLNATLSNFASHLYPKGLCIVEPYKTPDKWERVGLGLRTVKSSNRIIAMVDRAELNGDKVVREIAYSVATHTELEQIYEKHSYPLFKSEEYENAFRSAGFEVDFDEKGFIEDRGMFFGKLL